MQTIQRSFLAVALAAFVATPTFAAPPKGSTGSGGKGGTSIKCWTNSDGVQECGNAIPPEYAEGATRTVDKQGMTVQSQGRAMTAEERRAQEKKQKDAADQAAAEKARQEEQAKKDQVLLSTFASEQDIIMARERKLTAIEGTIELTNVSIRKQEQVVEGYRTRIANLEKSGKPVTEEMRGDMATEQQKLDNKTAYLAAKKTEIESLRAEYDGYLKRYRELMAERGRR